MKAEDFRVLLVDDEQVILNVLQQSLQETGYRCTAVNSGARALAEFHKMPTHLVITDIRMPGMSGVQLADALVKIRPETLLIFITGYAEYSSLSQAIKQRPFGFLEKPFLPDQLLSVAGRAFRHWRDRESAAEQGKALEESVAEKTRELEFKTERLMAEKELLHGIITNANFGLMAIDIAGMTHLLNPLACDLLSIEPSVFAQYHGMNYQSLLPDLCREKLSKLAEAVRALGNLQTTEFTNAATEKRLHVITYPIMHKNQPAALVFIVHDVTETEMLQKRLLQSAKLASIGELAAGVAHEINNPLGFVISNSNTLARYASTLRQYIEQLETIIATDGTPDAADRKTMQQLKKELDIDFLQTDLTELLKETVDGLNRVSKIVRDLKTFAHVDRDMAEPCDINNLIDKALNLAKNEIKYSLEIKKSLGPIPSVTGFPSQLVQVFTNMFINSAHAVRNNKGTLSITSELAGTAIRIRIADTGEGIPEKNLSRIFDPFFTTKPPGKGTGMGLSISYGIIERHGGTISVTSETGVGTEFVIELPLAALQADAQKKIREVVV